MRAETRVAALLVLAAAAAMAAEAEKFAGTWQATAKGTVFLVLKVQNGPKISGSMNAGSINMNEDGDLVEVGPVEDHEAPIFFAEVQGNKLAFDFQDEDAGVMHFELTLKGEAAGELRIIDKDHPKLKAIALKKVS
jgi:hypothetical protein